MSFYSEKFEVMLHDVDARNMIKPSALARYLQETATHQMRDRKPTYHELFNEGKSYILIRLSVQIYRILGPYEVIEVRTWTCPSKGATFKRNYSIFVGEEKVADAYSEWAVVDINDGKIYPVKEIEISNYEEGEPLEMTIPSKFRIPKDLVMKKVGENVVQYSDCDMNGHMNNTMYEDMLWNLVPDVQSKILTGFSIRFITAGMLGSKITITSAKAEEVVKDGAGAEESWYFKTSIDDGHNIEAVMNFKNE